MCTRVGGSSWGWRLALLVLLCLLMDPLGTVSHELGHWGMARLLGVPAVRHDDGVELVAHPIAREHTLIALGGPG